MPGRPAEAAPAAATSARVKALKLHRTCSRHSRPLLPVTCPCTAAGTAAAPLSAAAGRAARAAAGRDSLRSDMDTSLRCGTGGGVVAAACTRLLWALSPWAPTPAELLLAGAPAPGRLLAPGMPVGLFVVLTGAAGPAGSNAAAPMLSPGCMTKLLACAWKLGLRVCRWRYGGTTGSHRSLCAPDRSSVDRGTCRSVGGNEQCLQLAQASAVVAAATLAAAEQQQMRGAPETEAAAAAAACHTPQHQGRGSQSQHLGPPNLLVRQQAVCRWGAASVKCSAPSMRTLHRCRLRGPVWRHDACMRNLAHLSRTARA